MQRWRDVCSLIRKERRYQILLLLLAFSCLCLLLSKPSAKPRYTSQLNRFKPGSTEMRLNALNADTHVDLVNVFSQKQNDLLQTVRQMNTKLERVDQERKEFEDTTTQIFSQVIRKMNDSGKSEEDKNQPQNEEGREAVSFPLDLHVSQGHSPETKVNELESWEAARSTDIVPQSPPEPVKVAAVVTGCRVRARLASGVSAPVKGAPYPVTLDLMGDVICPNNLHLPLGQASVMGAAQGSLTDSRVLFRVSKLGLAFPSGRLREIEIDGWVVGEDGLRGLKGILKDPLGEILGAQIQAGVAQGIGDALAGSNVNERLTPLGGRSLSVTGEELDYSASQGLSQAAQHYAKVIEERSKEMIPHVEVLSGRDVTIVFARAFQIPGLMEELNANDNHDLAVD